MSLKELEKERKVSQKQTIVLIFLFFLFFYVGIHLFVAFVLVNPTVAIIALVVIILACGICALHFKNIASGFENKVKKELMPLVLQYTISDDGDISWHIEENSKIEFTQTFPIFGEYFLPQENFSGTYKSVDFLLSEYFVEGGSGKYKDLIMRGNIIKIPTNIDYLGFAVFGKKKIIASQKWEECIFAGLSALNLPSVLSNNRKVYASDATNIDKLLSPEFIEFVNNLPIKYTLAFFKKDLHIIYSADRDTFKMGSLWKKIDDPKQYEKFAGDLMEALSIVEKSGSITNF